MSLEVDGRSGDVAIAYQRQEETFLYANGDNPSEIPPNGQTSYAGGTMAESKQPSKPEDLGQGRRLRVRPGFMISSILVFALVAVLAIVAAGVAGSIAVRRGKHIDTWFVHISLSARTKY